MIYTVGSSRHRREWWEVRRGRILLAEGTESESHIMAWALNAIAEGGTLESKRPVGKAGDYGVAPPDATVYEFTTYDGLTEGVAP